MAISRFQIVSALAVFATAGAAFSARAAEPASALPSTVVSAHFLSVLPVSHAGHFALQASGQAAQSSQKVDPTDPLPPGKGKELTQQTCSGCHAVTMFASLRQTHDQWSSTIDDMLSKGLSASDQDLDTILTYLSTNLAPPKNSTTTPATPPAAPSATPPQQ